MSNPDKPEAQPMKEHTCHMGGCWLNGCPQCACCARCAEDRKKFLERGK